MRARPNDVKNAKTCQILWANAKVLFIANVVDAVATTLPRVKLLPGTWVCGGGVGEDWCNK